MAITDEIETWIAAQGATVADWIRFNAQNVGEGFGHGVGIGIAESPLLPAVRAELNGAFSDASVHLQRVADEVVERTAQRLRDEVIPAMQLAAERAASHSAVSAAESAAPSIAAVRSDFDSTRKAVIEVGLVAIAAPVIAHVVAAWLTNKPLRVTGRTTITRKKGKLVARTTGRART